VKLLNRIAAQAGVGLIELLVSITIGLFVLAGVLQLYITSTQNVSTFEGSSRIQENARYAFNKFERDIGQAGNMGCFSFTTVNNRIDNILDTEDKVLGSLYDFTRFIDGENDTGDSSAGANSSDKLFVRYASSEDRYPIIDTDATSITLPDGAGNEFSQFQVAIVGDCSTATVFAVSAQDANTISHASFTNADEPSNSGSDLIGTFISAEDADSITEGTSVSYVYGGDSGAVEYAVGLSAAGNTAGGACNGTTPQYCALIRNGVEIVEGVEDLQFEYGWEDAAGALFFKNSAAVDTAEAVVSGIENVWPLIDRVRVTATFNSINTANTNEGIDFLRRTYSRVFVIHNQLPVCADC